MSVTHGASFSLFGELLYFDSTISINLRFLIHEDSKLSCTSFNANSPIYSFCTDGSKSVTDVSYSMRILTYVFMYGVAYSGVGFPVGDGFLEEGEEDGMVHVDLIDLIEDVIHKVTVEDTLALQGNHVALKSGNFVRKNLLIKKVTVEDTLTLQGNHVALKSPSFVIKNLLIKKVTVEDTLTLQGNHVALKSANFCIGLFKMFSCWILHIFTAQIQSE